MAQNMYARKSCISNEDIRWLLFNFRMLFIVGYNATIECDSFIFNSDRY